MLAAAPASAVAVGKARGLVDALIAVGDGVGVGVEDCAKAKLTLNIAKVKANAEKRYLIIRPIFFIAPAGFDDIANEIDPAD